MYYCKNCGEPYHTDEAVICVRCGVAKGQGTNYCHNCGNLIAPGAAVCMNCGVPAGPMVVGKAKSKIAAGLLGIFLGSYGAHNFYLGYTAKAVVQLTVTLVGYLLCCVVIGILPVIGIWVWSIVEAIMILAGKIDRDARGVPLTD